MHHSDERFTRDCQANVLTVPAGSPRINILRAELCYEFCPPDQMVAQQMLTHRAMHEHPRAQEVLLLIEIAIVPCFQDQQIRLGL